MKSAMKKILLSPGFIILLISCLPGLIPHPDVDMTLVNNSSENVSFFSRCLE